MVCAPLADKRAPRRRATPHRRRSKQGGPLHNYLRHLRSGTDDGAAAAAENEGQGVVGVWLLSRLLWTKLCLRGPLRDRGGWWMLGGCQRVGMSWGRRPVARAFATCTGCRPRRDTPENDAAKPADGVAARSPPCTPPPTRGLLSSLPELVVTTSCKLTPCSAHYGPPQDNRCRVPGRGRGHDESDPAPAPHAGGAARYRIQGHAW